MAAGSGAEPSVEALAESQVERGWSLNLYVGAGEAGGAWQSGNRKPRDFVPAGEAADPDRAAAEAARRARGKIRRYCTANRLNRLGTLTYRGAGNHDPVLLRLHLGEFFRGLRSGLGGRPVPYLWVPEWHKGGHGLHAHFAVGQFVKRGLIEAAWPHGFVHIKLIGDLPVGTGPIGEARRAAGYLAKYVGKDFDHEKLLGRHRYEVAQGFQPEPVTLHGYLLDDVMRQAIAAMGRPPSYVWQSQISEGWQGPPAVWAAWE